MYAVTDPDKGFGGITAFVVEKGSGGFRAGQKFEKMGLRSCPIGELVLEDVRVGRSADALLQFALGQIEQARDAREQIPTA